MEQLKKDKLKRQSVSPTGAPPAAQPVAYPRASTSPPVAASRVQHPAAGPVAAPRATTVSPARSGLSGTAVDSPDGFETKVLSSQELHSAFAEPPPPSAPAPRPLAPPPPGFSSFGEILKPTVVSTNVPPKKIDLESLTLKEAPVRTFPANQAMGFMPNTSVQMSPAIVIPLSTLNTPYGMQMASPAYPMAGNQYWMQPRMMMLGQPPAGMGWTHPPPQPASLPLRPQFQEPVSAKPPNDPFGVL